MIVLTFSFKMAEYEIKNASILIERASIIIILVYLVTEPIKEGYGCSTPNDPFSLFRRMS